MDDFHVPRFWAPVGQPGQVEGPGYLLDRTPTLFGVFWGEEVRPTSHIISHSCLVLLGEPGSGKTAAIEEIGRLIAEARPNFDVRPVIRLGSYGDESRLLSDVFGPSPAGGADAQPTVVLLDGLDECKLNIPHVGMLITQQLTTLRPGQLHLVISCRNVDWPSSLGAALAAHYKDFGAYELQPLRRTDVGVLASAAGADPDRFLEAVDACGVGALATRPLSLQLLLRAYDPATESLPDGQQALYEKALLALAEEVNPGRRDAGMIGQLSPRRRLALAERIAAAMHFAGATALWTGAAADAPEGDLTVDGLLDAHESLRGEAPLTRRDVEEVLDTALFSGRGASRIGWAHQTYMEFLTASHLALNADSTRTRLLLCDEEGKVIPRLRPVAAWLTSLEPEFLRDAIASDPASFIGLGVDLRHDHVKEMVVAGLLGQAAAGRYLWDRPSYAHLGHSGLEAQLRPVLEDRTQHDDVRTVAIDISEDNLCLELQDAWAAITLDVEAAARLRKNAGYAVASLGNETTRHQLLPLALGQAGEDPDDELKGIGLSACWPGALTLAELLPLLTAPKDNHGAGAYKSFLISDLPQHINDADVTELLEWLAGLPWDDEADSHHAFGPLLTAVVGRALELLPDPAMSEGVVALALRLGRLHVHVDRWPTDAVAAITPEGRAALIHGALNQVQDSYDAHLLAESGVALFSPDDFPSWLEHCLQQEADLPRMLGELTSATFRPERLDHVELVLALDREGALYREHFARWCEPMSLDSKAARNYARFRSRRRPSDGPTEDDIRKRLFELLARADAGELDCWWQFCLGLTLIPGEPRATGELSDDLTARPGWQLLSEADRSRALDLAHRYLREFRLEHQDWLTTNTWHRPALAGYQAAALLLRHDPERLSALPAGAWGEWAGICVTYPVGNEAGDRRIRKDLLERAYQAAPEAVTTELRALIGSEAERDYLPSQDAIEAIWDDRVAEALYEKLGEPELVDSLWSELIDTLVEHAYAPAVEHAMAVVHDHGARTEQRLAAGLALLAQLDPTSWPCMSTLLNDAPEFARDLFLSAGGREAVRLRQLDEAALHDLYVWMHEQFPPAEDPEIKSDFGSPRERVARVRDRAISMLAERGTTASVEALEGLAARFDEWPWLRVQALHAEEARRRNAWTPISPQVLFRLLDNPAGRLVRSAAELASVVAEAIADVQRILSENSEAMFLWDGNRPKPEEHVSHYLAMRLRDRLEARGIVTNREVQVRPSASGTGMGPRTDIHIDAAATSSGVAALTRATVVVEVKGIWHDQVATAMRSQLWERYLKPAGLAHGLYIVLVPDGNRWDPDDAGQRRATRRLAQGLEQKLHETADALTAEGAQIVPVLLRY